MLFRALLRSLLPAAAAAMLVLALTLAATALLAGGCDDGTEPPSYVARVGEQYLRPGDVKRALGSLPPGADSTVARRQFIRQWTTRALLYREARQRDLAADSSVQKRLEESRRSVLVNALLKRLYDEASKPPTREAMRTYFDRHREALRFSVPHVRVRHLTTGNAADARAAHRRLRQATRHGGGADTAWAALRHRYAADTARAHRLADDMLPEPSLFSDQPAVREHLSSLEDGQLAPVFGAGGRYHVLQLVKRMPVGALPELGWVEDEIRRRLVLQRRKQTYTRQVERLRSRARAGGVLERAE